MMSVRTTMVFYISRKGALVLLIYAGLFYGFQLFLPPESYWSSLITRFSILITIAALTLLLGDLAAWMTKSSGSKWTKLLVHLVLGVGMLVIIFGFFPHDPPVKPKSHEFYLTALMIIPCIAYLFIFIRNKFGRKWHLK